MVLQLGTSFETVQKSNKIDLGLLPIYFAEGGEVWNVEHWSDDVPSRIGFEKNGSTLNIRESEWWGPISGLGGLGGK